MRIVFISDTHGHQGLSLPVGDVLVHCGDATSTGTPAEMDTFLAWFAAQPHSARVLVAGNHDGLWQKSPDLAAMMLLEYPGINYLQDSGVTLGGVRFWGSPWQPAFNDWHFNLPRRGPGLRAKWSLIPKDTDVLITHGPPYGILDQIHPAGEHLGCEELRSRLAAVRPRLHAFGHIHGGWGIAQSKDTLYVNASTCDENYRPGNRPIVVDLSPSAATVMGIEESSRKQQVRDLRSLLDAAKADPEILQATLQEAFRGLAELRGVPLDELAEDYLMRGLRSDLAQLDKVEGKPSKRPIPIKILPEEPA